MLKKDFVFSSYWYLKFVNKLFKGGKKNKLLKYLYGLIIEHKNLSIDFFLLFKEALEVLKTPMALKRVSLKHEIPFYISEHYQYSQSLFWLVKSLKKKKLGFSLMEELFLVVSLSSSSLSLKYKKDFENKLYKNRFFKNLSLK